MLVQSFEVFLCFNGRQEVPVYCYFDGYSYYYVQHGGHVVNLTYDEIKEGINLNDIYDFDCFSSTNPIETIEQLINLIEE